MEGYTGVEADGFGRSLEKVQEAALKAGGGLTDDANVLVLPPPVLIGNLPW